MQNDSKVDIMQDYFKRFQDDINVIKERAIDFFPLILNMIMTGKRFCEI